MASEELPLCREDERYWERNHYYNAVNYLIQTGNLVLHEDNGKKTYRSSGDIKRTGFRGENEKYSAVLNGKVLEQFRYPYLLKGAHAEAIIITLGRTFLVEKVDIDSRTLILSEIPSI